MPRRKHHALTINIVRFDVRTGPPVVKVPRVLGKCLVGKYGRFVHVVPESTYAYLANVSFAKGRPPVAYAWHGEIWKMTDAGPNVAL